MGGNIIFGIGLLILFGLNIYSIAYNIPVGNAINIIFNLIIAGLINMKATVCSGENNFFINRFHRETVEETTEEICPDLSSISDDKKREECQKVNGCKYTPANDQEDESCKKEG